MTCTASWLLCLSWMSRPWKGCSCYEVYSGWSSWKSWQNWGSTNRRGLVTIITRAGIYILVLSKLAEFLIFPENGKVFALFQKKSEKSHIFQDHFWNQTQNRDQKLYDKNKIIHGYVISVILTKFRINANLALAPIWILVMEKFLIFSNI